MTTNLTKTLGIYSQFSTLVDVLHYRSLHQPNQVVYTFLGDGETESNRLTYAQLNYQVRSLASHLQSLGARGERALLLYPSGLEFIVAFLACLYSGAIAVPAYLPRRNRSLLRLQTIVADSEAKFALTTESVLANIESQWIRNSDLGRLKWLATDTVQSSLDAGEPISDRDSLAFLQYTSGSTGKPKGVMVSHGNLLHNSEYIRQAFELTPKSVSVSWLPGFHDMGLIDGIIQPLYTGFSAILMPPNAFVEKPIRWLQAISKYQATHSGGPNFSYDLCVKKVSPAQCESLNLESWTSAYNGAEPVRRSTLEQFVFYFQSCGFKANFFYPCYGMAEATLMISGGLVKEEPVYYTVDAEALERNQVLEASESTAKTRDLVGCGLPWLETKIAIADPESLVSCPPDRVGEIWVANQSIAQGYWQLQKQSKETFQAYLADTKEGPFLRTGDLGFIKDGELFVTGRLKDIVIIRGRNFYPQDIELTIEKSHDAIIATSSAAFSIDVDGQEQLVIVTEINRHYKHRYKIDTKENIKQAEIDKFAEIETIVANIRQAVAREYELEVYAIQLLRFGSIPKTSSGKIQRYACRTGFIQNNLNVIYSWTKTPVLEPNITSQSIVPLDKASLGAIQDWWLHELSKLLQLKPEAIPLYASLSELGIDSLKAVILVGDLSSWLDIKISSSLLYESENIADFCSKVAMLAAQKYSTKEQNKSLLNIAVAATFTAEPIEECLSFWLNRLSWHSQIQFAPYNQLFQELLNPQSLLHTNSSGINLILFRVEDWFRYQNQLPNITTIYQTIDEFLNLVKNSVERSSSRWIVSLCPHSQTFINKLGLKEIINELDNYISERLEKISGLILTDLRKLAADYGVKEIFDPVQDRLGHIPFTKEYFTAMGTTVARKIFTSFQSPYKVIAIDCDNTLWQGICGEDAPADIQITSPYLFLQEFLVAQQSMGKLLCLCSKNSEADVWAVFDYHSQMPLQRNHLVSYRINWQSKSQNLRELAAELQLGLDSFIFIDDNPVECAQVKAEVPNVLVVQLPQQSQEIPNYLRSYWAFDTLKVTEEDRQRTEYYQQNQQRELLQKQVGGFQDFLAQLQLEIEIAALKTDDLERAVQLIQRTNQFNATTIRRSEGELRQWLHQAEHHAFSVCVKDRFGDYGFVGLMLVIEAENQLQIETFLLSCRVLSKQVEHEMVRFLAKWAIAHGVEQLYFLYRPSDRNQPLKNFYQTFEQPFTLIAKNTLCINLKASEIDTILAKSKNNNHLSAPVQQEQKPSVINGVLSSQEKDVALNSIALIGSQVERILQVMRSQKKNRLELSTSFITPRTALQKKIAILWCDILGLDRVGIADNFFELGGDSLKLAELIANLSSLGVAETFSLSILENPTVAGLAQAIEDIQQGKKPHLIKHLSSLEEEAQLDEAINLNGLPLENIDSPKTIFLTGGTGYFGGYLLSELLRETDAIIYCHVRAKTVEEGRRRIEHNLRRYELWNDAFFDRISIILGNLEQSYLGISQDRYEQLSLEIDAIFHAGAWVNFIFPYNLLKSANVMGTEAILRFATYRKLKQIHFISTLGVLMSGGYGKEQVIYEREPLKYSEDLPNGYEQTKWVADRMVWKAMSRGIPASIYRLGMLSGLSETGVYHKLNEFLPSFLKGCIQLGSFPDLETKIEMVPVDFISKSLVKIAQNPQNLGKVYHMNHPQAITSDGFIEFIRDFGYPLRALPWDVWKKELLNSGSRLRENSLYPFLDFIKALQEHQTYIPEMDMENFLNGIYDLAIHCPDQKQLLNKYFQYFIEVNYFVPPNLKE